MKACLCLIAAALFASAQEPFAGGPALDAIIQQAIAEKEIPGAVLVVGHNGQMVYKKAYGSRALVPRREPMSLDTIFDAASLTKVVATTASIMRLFEQGKVRLADPVTVYLPEFQGGRSAITVRHLLTHFSGLRPDVDLKPEWTGYGLGIKKALEDRPVAAPDAQYIYSDINFVLLGEMVARVSGKPLSEFAREQIFSPLGMKDTMFQPPPQLRDRIAPTEAINGQPPLRGVVHDPTARFMGGVAGHAGMFTTAADLAKFAEMMLAPGTGNGVRLFSPMTVRRFTSPATPEGQPVLRGLGWDIDSPHSSNRGELFPVGSFGHTGFTGTSLWIDPHTRSYVILLSNSVHPKLGARIVPLRARVATAAAAALNVDLPQQLMSYRPYAAALRPQSGEVLSGLDVLEKEKFASLQGKTAGLITNHTGLTRDGRRNIDAMLAGGVNLKALYSPEHGIGGSEDHENVVHGKDVKSGLPVWSLYAGANRRPSEEMLRGLDTLIFDIQDIGARFYTYTCTMRNAMEEAARRNLEFIVLDRPNPVTGKHVEGPVLEPALKSFIGCIEMPLRHGMTMGELARMVNEELQPKARLRVVQMQNWRRDYWFDETGLPWVDPSPNMRSLNAATLYPGIGMLEGGKVYSVGRGSDAPFEQVGASWINGPDLARYLNARNIPGIRVYPTIFEPKSSNFSDQRIGGIRFVVTDREHFPAVRFGLELGAALAKLFPGKMDWKANEKLVGNSGVLRGLANGEDAASIERETSAGLAAFLRKRQSFLLY